MSALRETKQPGLRQWAETAALMSNAYSQPMPSMRPLTEGCKATALADPVRQQACAAAAEALWQGGATLLESTIALRLAQRLPTAGDPRWAARRVEHEAQRQALIESSNALMAEVIPFENVAIDVDCRGQALMNGFIRRTTRLSERAWAVQLLAGQDSAVLAARWRADNPPQPAASAAVTAR